MLRVGHGRHRTGGNEAVSSTTQFLPSDLANQLAWYRFNTGITIAGSGVSQWNDQFASANHLVQGTDANRPSNSGGIITFNGVAFFLAVTFGATQAQPLTWYVLLRQISWTNINPVIDQSGGTDSSTLLQGAVTPNLQLYAGAATVADNSNVPVDTNFYPVAFELNGASSLIHVRGSSATTGNPGALGMTGLRVGANFNGTKFGNIAVKEVIGYTAAHDATTRGQVLDYLATL